MHAAQDKAHFPVDQLAYVYNKANGDVVEMHHVRVGSDDVYAGGGVEVQIFQMNAFVAESSPHACVQRRGAYYNLMPAACITCPGCRVI